MTTDIQHPKAQTGRRVEYRVHSSVNDDRADVYAPGIITGTTTATNGALLLKVRLDGQRKPLNIPADFEALRYLNEIVPVPDLPMGHFQPTSQHPGFDFQYDGVLLVEFEDGDLAVLTADRAKAEAAVATYVREYHDLDETQVGEELAELKPRWVVFEWQPEDAEFAWLMNPADETADQALQVHYLPPA